VLFSASPHFIILDMDKAEDEVVVSGTEVEKHGRDVAEEKPMSKRQLKMQKRREEWLTRKAERRCSVLVILLHSAL